MLWSGDNECDTNLSVAGINPADNKVTRVALKNAVVDNQGLAIISARLIKDELESGKLFIVKNKECI
mgnify:CR=1 FL=1